jgi:hypothetical protein
MVDLMDGTGGAVIAFLDYTGEKGLVNPGTAKAMKVAVREVLEQAEGPGWQSTDVRGLDAEDVLQRFNNKTAGRFTPKSLQAYQGRFRKALSMYSQYVKDPGGWRPVKQPRLSSQSRRRMNGSRPEEQSSPQHSSPVDENPDMMTYPFPLRRDGNVVFARLILPHDLTPREAERIGDHIRTLAVDEPKHEPDSESDPTFKDEPPF